MIGGIDKHVPRRSREEIVAELEYKIPPEAGRALLGTFAVGDQAGAGFMQVVELTGHAVLGHTESKACIP